MYYTVRGLVLRSQVSAEADTLITLYTREWGKISALVPGARKIKAKLKAVTEPVSENDFMVYLNHPQARAKVTGAQIVESFSVLRGDWRRLLIAQYCAEITEALTPFNAENERKYELLGRTWTLLGTARHPWRIFAAYVLRFLHLSGYSFTEYLRQHQSFIPAGDRACIHILATRSGNEVDCADAVSSVQEKNIRRYLEQYLDLYIPYPLKTREFLRKLETTELRAKKIHHKTRRPIVASGSARISEVVQ